MSVAAEKYGKSVIGSEMQITSFNKLGRDQFQIMLRGESDQITLIKESIRFFSLDLPAEIKEIFISYNEAPLFWIFESSLLNQIEEFMKFNFKGGAYAELHKQTKENYSRWATTKLKSEKEYYSTTTINFIERDVNKHNFFKMILKGIIFTYQSTYYNPSKALELFANTFELVNTLRLNEQTKSEIKYILKLYTGFVYLKESDNENASSAFKDALEVKPQGCTAKIYAALTEVNMGSVDLAAYYLKEVLSYDIQRLSIALKTNNVGMFNYFFKNAFIYNVFYYKDFAKAVDSIQIILNEYRPLEANLLEKCREDLEKIKKRKLDEYYDDEIIKTLAFADKIFQLYAKSKSTLLLAAYPEFKRKLNSIVDSIVFKIKDKFYKEVKESLNSFDLVIKDNLSAEKHLMEELENFKTKSKEILSNTINTVQNSFDSDAKAIEARIENLPNIDKYNPRISLANNMTYNTIIALVVFVIGGMSSYSNRFVDNTSEFNSLFAQVLVSGSKWGAISFLLGVIISLVITGVILLERFDIKSNLQKRLNLLRLEKESAIAELKEASRHKEKIMIESMTSSIQAHKKRVEETNEIRAVAEKERMNAANLKIEELTADLVKILA
ncbi:MAG: hypothetical protein FD143_1818 [Ignavibacteria bacterium]|nr:MAG: hypothetical protein FD143_1818 [Ignavibacteria bacterium]KAF0160165.1 MAG: hypothetical protein FD188_1979 [Ignavibacteria bacterium]